MCLGHEQAGSYRFVRRIGTGKALTFLVLQPSTAILPTPSFFVAAEWM